ncbi:MAG: UDP-N-acetylmuramoyl-tripeptide--D-alanyl-D-alanine ligase [Clostridia bacterium]|nr:UDP-N-acetylmuramoyl-tripeptide--D-alanyl-D-alanine ligase [Clostridia bacterium]
MGIFISVPKTIECVLAAVIFTALFAPCFYKLLGILQSCGYSGKKFFGWARKKNNLVFTRHSLLTLLLLMSSAGISFLFAFVNEWAAIIGCSSYIIFLIVYTWADNRVALKTPVVATPRFKRLYIILIFIIAVLAYLAIVLLNFADAVWGNRFFNLLRYVPLSLFPLLMIPLAAFANLCAKIYEVPHNKKYVKAAREKLKANPVKVVGITGSYGKTSTKQILAQILSKKFRVLSTPRSHNTPLGLALAINDNDLNDFDIFVAEMGARHLGDIEELCQICPPDYSIISGICPQHLESFGTIENVVKAKSEILAYTKEEAVIAEDCFELFASSPCRVSPADCVSNILCGCEGTSFDLTLGGKTESVKTKLLGRHCAQNIALAAAVAFKLGMSLEEIKCAVEELDFIEHRLQLIKSGEVNILDDGYNSNVKGAAAALEVLKNFKGRKICVTPGLVELGILEEEENRALGGKLTGLDFVILVGDTLIAPVKEGYLSNGGDAQKLKVVPSLNAAQNELKGILAAGDTVLFLNDLPDIY